MYLIWAVASVYKFLGLRNANLQETSDDIVGMIIGKYNIKKAR